MGGNYGYGVGEGSDVIVTSLIFINKKWLYNIKDYTEGLIFRND